MKILFFRSVILLLSISSVSYGNDFRFSYEKPVPILGGSDANKDNLQRSGLVKVDKIAVHYFIGEALGLFVGFTSSRERADYYQRETSARQYGYFSSNFMSAGPEIGFWLQPYEKPVRLEAGLELTNGSFELSDSEFSIANLPDTRKLDMHAGCIFSFDVFSSYPKLDLFAKLGHYKVYINDFTYHGVTYSIPELNLKSYIYFSFGLGVRF